MKRQYVSLEKTLKLMREGASLLMMHTTRPGQKDYFIIRKGGGKVLPTDAQKIIARPDVVAQGDGLFPGITQTWRMGV